MQYMLLIVEPRGQREARGVVEGRKVYDEMLGSVGELERRGVLVAAQALKSDRAGVRVNVAEGKRMLVDGPFAEAKEMVGGFFLVDCATRQEAIDIAASLPAARWATIEVREVGACYE